MSENVKTFILFDNQKEYIDLMSDEQAGKLVKALYAKNRGEDVTFSDPLVQMAFMIFWQAIENGRARREQLRENGSKGGRPKANQNQEKPNNNQSETKNNQDITKTEPSEKQSDTDLDLDLSIKENTNVFLSKSGDFDATPEQGSLVDTPTHEYPRCPQEKILSLYREILPSLPDVRTLRPNLQSQVRARWNEKCHEKGFSSQEEGIEYFRKFFAYVAENDFLTGRKNNGQRKWRCSYAWLMKAANFDKVTSGYYSEGDVA